MRFMADIINAWGSEANPLPPAQPVAGARPQKMTRLMTTEGHLRSNFCGETVAGRAHNTGRGLELSSQGRRPRKSSHITRNKTK